MNRTVDFTMTRDYEVEPEDARPLNGEEKWRLVRTSRDPDVLLGLLAAVADLSPYVSGADGHLRCYYCLRPIRTSHAERCLYAWVLAAIGERADVG